MTLRTAVMGDLPALREVFRASALSNPGDVDLLLAHPEYLEFAGDGIAAGRTRVSCVDDRIVGFATLVPGEHGDAELEDLFVLPVEQRRGHARRLMADAVDVARRTGHQRILVDGNPHALAFYRAVGFVELEVARTTPGPGLRLTLEL